MQTITPQLRVVTEGLSFPKYNMAKIPLQKIMYNMSTMLDKGRTDVSYFIRHRNKNLRLELNKKSDSVYQLYDVKKPGKPKIIFTSGFESMLSFLEDLLKTDKVGL